MEDGKDDKTLMMPFSEGGEPASGKSAPATPTQLELEDATHDEGEGGAQDTGDVTRVAAAPARPDTPGAPSTAGVSDKDDATRMMPFEAQDDDATRMMSFDEEDDDATRMMSFDEEDDDATRTMSVDGEENDATQMMSAASVDGDSTRMMSPSADERESATQIMPGAGLGGAQVQPAGDNTLAAQKMARVSTEEYANKTVINNRFVLEKLMGVGGMGSVYKAKDLRKVEAQDRNPWVAVKLLNDDFKQHPLAFMSLQREARKSQALAHPNIVQVFDFDRDGDSIYMTMELLQGYELADHIKANPEGVELEEATRLMREMGAALQHAHSNNITHADFKPGNVFLTDTGIAKVLDFGIAQAVAHKDVGVTEDDKTAFDPGSLGALTPAYASLEMLEGKDPLPTDDIYALGCIVYQLLTGKHPYERLPATIALEKGKRPQKIDKLNRRQWRSLQQAIALKREDRYETVEDFQNDFAPQVNPWARWLGVAIGIVVVVGGAGFYQAYNEAADVRAREQQVAVDSLRVEAERKASIAIDAAVARLRDETERVKRELTQHRFGFESTSSWRQIKAGKLAQLRAVYEAPDWSAALRDFGDLESDTIVALRRGAEERANTAAASTEQWISNYRENVAKDYLKLAGEQAFAGSFTDARASIDEAAALDPGSPSILQVGRQLESLIADNRRENQEIARVAREAAALQAQIDLNTDFQAADAVIREDLKSCTKTLSRTGRGGDFTYNIGALADKVNAMRKRFAALGDQVTSAVAAYADEVGACVQVYGYADPAAAKQQIAIAQRSFPAQASRLGALPIFPWDACKPSFAGKGERYDCQDRFLGKNSKGPTLVVIPSGNGLASFAIGKYEVSESDFNEWCKATGACEVSSAEALLPVTGRSHAEVNGYIDWLSEATGFKYELPSREQWTYAADAQGTGLDPGRNCTLSSRGIMKGQVMLPVDLGAHNSWGLVHHVGNARELVRDGSGMAAVGGARVDPMDSCTVQATAPADSDGGTYTGFRVMRTR